MTFKRKVILKSIIILILLPITMWTVFNLVLVWVTAPRCPDERLKKALELMKSESYIGMTLEECEEIFGDSGVESPEQVISYPVGTFQWMGYRNYIFYIYFDEENTVWEVRLEEESEI